MGSNELVGKNYEFSLADTFLEEALLFLVGKELCIDLCSRTTRDTGKIRQEMQLSFRQIDTRLGEQHDFAGRYL